MNKEEEIKILKEGIKKYAPVVAEFFDKEENILQYSENLYDYAVDKEYLKRQKDLCRVMEKYIKRLFSEKTDIKPPLIINIVDHHAILNHPILLATNIVANAYRLINNKEKKPIAVLTSSVVPLNNFFNKKGFQFHGRRVPLFSNKEMHQASCFVGRHDFNFTQRLKDIGRWQEFNPKEQEFLSNIEEEILNLDYSKAKNYNDQISLIDRFLWKRLFAEEIREEIPGLYYLTQEDIMRDILPSFLKKDNIISKAIFDDDFRKVILDNFQGLIGCWDGKNKKGTHFFWYKNEKNEAARLYLKNNALISEDKTKKIKLEREEIISLMEKEEIVPNLFVIFGFMTFWAGLRPLVGHGSCNYLTKMKDAWLKTLKDFNQEEHDRLSGIDTKGLIGGEIVTYGRDENGEIVDLYAFDVIEKGGLTKEYLKNIFKMKYKDLLKPALIEIYNSYVPVTGGERVDLGLKPQDMMGEEFSWIK